ncbi:hypothetical protein ACVBEF_11595 [Glaciimonas sp. GG7]
MAERVVRAGEELVVKACTEGAEIVWHGDAFWKESEHNQTQCLIADV